ncbi:MAG: HAD-IA family hydrolase [Gemmatimonadota bacterium]
MSHPTVVPLQRPPAFTAVAVAFDLLTGLLDSWTLWNRVAGGAELGLRWRKEYLRQTYGAGRYRPYEDLVRSSADVAGVERRAAERLFQEWETIEPWPEAQGVLAELARRVPLAVVTNCSERLATAAVAAIGVELAVVVTAERAGWYKPRPEPYALALQELGLSSDRVLFVAGSPSDIGGAGGLGMRVFWHNRIGLELLPAMASSGTHLVATAPSLLPLIELVPARDADPPLG